MISKKTFSYLELVNFLLY